MAVENDSYCAEADVVARVHFLTDFTSGTVPTEAQVLEFMAGRAAELHSLLVEVMGDEAPGPASYSVTVDTTTDVGKALDFVLKQYNAIGAAFDALSAAGATHAGENQMRQELFALWENREAAIKPLASRYAGYANRASTAYSIAEISEASVSSREEDGFTFTGETEW